KTNNAVYRGKHLPKVKEYRVQYFSKKACFLLVIFSGFLSFINQFAMIGTKVCEAINDAIMANATAIESGINISLEIPVMINVGVKTARILNRIRSFGTDISNNASLMALCFGFPTSTCW